MRRPPSRGLLIAAMVMCAPARTQPARWWRSSQLVARLHATAAQCHELERLYERTLPTQRRASVDMAQTIDAISHELNDGFNEARLLGLTQHLVHVQSEQGAVLSEVSRRTRDVCVRQHAPEWLVTKVLR